MSIAKVNKRRKARGTRVVCEACEGRTLLSTVPAGFTDTQIYSGLTSPTALDIAPDGRVFLAQQNGIIRVVKNDQMLSAPFADLSSEVDSSNERGMLGLTLDPNFTSNHYVYVYYTATSPTTHNRIARLVANGDTMLSGSETDIADFPDIGSAIWHMGGPIHFGPDGKLYVGVGDHQQSAQAQSLSSVFGKILRLNADGSIPTDDPFYNQTTGINRAIYALGFRNPFTFDFQPGTGILYANDVGDTSWEEIDQVTAGANYGWPNTEGDFNQATYPNFTRPTYTYSHSVGYCIAGASFYSPAVSKFPSQYVGKFFFVDFSFGWMKTMDPVTHVVSNFGTGFNFPTDMEVADDGTMYFLQRGMNTGTPTAGSGSLHKLDYPSANTPVTFSQQPQDQSGGVGQQVTFSVSVQGTPPFTYQWKRNNQTINGATSAILNYTVTASDDNAQFTCTVTNNSGPKTSNPGTLHLLTGDPPVPSIDTPAAGTNWNAGQTINFSGSATDTEDVTLPASAFTWEVDYYTDNVARPLLLPTTGSKTGSFNIPASSPFTGTAAFFRIILTVQDSTGFVITTTRDISPNVATATFATNIPGLSVMLDGASHTSPYSADGIVGLLRNIEAPLTETLNGATYQFVSWSDNGAAAHQIGWPPSTTTYTANYQLVPITYVSDLTPTTSSNGYGPFEKDKSNGEQGAGDGHTLTLGGTTYAKGLGVHAASSLTYSLNGQFTQFLSDVGVDDEVGSNGTVDFQVFLDNAANPIYDSGKMTGTTATKQVTVDVTGKTTLKLVVTTAGDNNNSDHADWANARLAIGGGGGSNQPPVTVADSATATVNQPVLINVLSNDSDPGGAIDPTTVSIATPPIHGSVSVDPVTGAVTYTPATDSTSSDSFFYTVKDNQGATSSPAQVSVTVASAGGAPVYLSDLTPTFTQNGWGPYEKDKSNGEQAAGDGHTITLNGATYAKGLGVHAASDLRFNLTGGSYSEFRADIGVDDEKGTAGSVIFQVYVDNTLKYTSPKMTGASATQSVIVPVAGGSTLRLVVTDSGDGNTNDHADWANARLIQNNGILPPAAPTGLTAVYSNNEVDLSWTDASSDEMGFRVERKTTINGNYSQIRDLGVGVTSMVDTDLLPGTTYYYHVYAYNAGGLSQASIEAHADVPTQPGSLVYLSDLTPTLANNGYGPYEKDTSNGQQPAGDGNAITLGGVAYDKGLGVHAPSDLRYNIAGNTYSEFRADIGVDDEVGTAGSVVFQVYLDNTLAYTSSTMTGTSNTVSIVVPITTGTSTLRLVVTDSGNGNTSDHADWASARLIVGQPVPPPATTYVSDLTPTAATSGFGPYEKDKSNGESLAGDGHTITLNGATYAKGLGVHAPSDITFNLNAQYTQFLADIGIDDEKGSAGSVVFQVYLDGTKVFDSGTMTGASATQSVNLNVTGKTTLRLVVTDGGNGNNSDHADWAGAKLLS